MDKFERYLFDVQGFLLLKGLLSAAEVTQFNQLLDGYDLWSNRGTGRFREVWENGPEYTTVGPLHEWDEPFRRLVADERIIGYLCDLISPTYRYDHGHVLLMRSGASHLRLHGGGTPWDEGQYYTVRDGHIRNGLIAVSYALTDTPPEGGGFVAIPGSHKANFSLPDEYRAFADGGAPVVHVPVRAGDVIIFSEALTHGTAPWTADTERRAMLCRFCPGSIAIAGDERKDADRISDEVQHDETRSEIERRVLRPPYLTARSSIMTGFPE
jgi:hypothetical protein